MTALDWILLLIVAVSGLLGLFRGMIGVVMSLVAWLLAGLAAYLFGGDVGRSLVTDGQPGWGEYLGGYALSFAVVWIAVALIGLVVRRIVQGAGLSGVDRAFGFGLGIARGLFFACALLLMLGLTQVPAKRAWRESTGVAVLLPVAAWMRGAMPPWMAQRVDLEGRGTSLQAQVEAQTEQLKRAMPEALPAAIPEVLNEALPEPTRQTLPSTHEPSLPSPDPKQVTPDASANGSPNAKGIH